MKQNRREALKYLGLMGVALNGLSLPLDLFAKGKKYKISLAQWSLHRSLFSGKLDHLDFPEKAKKDFNIDIVEYVSVFFKQKETDKKYLTELLNRTKDLGVYNHLIMVDGEGDLGDLDTTKRNKSVENHFKWIDAIKFLGGETIRVNASGNGDILEVKKAATEGLVKLTEYAAQQKINVIVENHGGYSSNASWLVDVIKGISSKYCGVLPDFGNFKISYTEEYDKYLGVKELMPFAKGVSAKTFNLDEQGFETSIDYNKMFEIIRESGWKGIIGIEYEGDQFSEDEGILLTKKLIEKFI